MNYFHFFVAYCGGAFTMWMLMRPAVEEYTPEPVKLITRKTETGWSFTEPGFNLGPGESCEVKTDSNGRVTRHD